MIKAVAIKIRIGLFNLSMQPDTTLTRAHKHSNSAKILYNMIRLLCRTWIYVAGDIEEAGSAVPSNIKQ